MKGCYVYVLRYNYSGNYYVGSTTGDLGIRMKTHLKENHNQDTPLWSCENKSSEGFKSYWFCIKSENDSQSITDYSREALQSIGDQCENDLCNCLIEMKRRNKDAQLDKETYVIGGSKTKKEDYKDFKIEKNGSIYNSLDKEIDKYLKSLDSFDATTDKGVFRVIYNKVEEYKK